VAERSGGTALGKAIASESGVALRFPPQSKKLIGSLALPRGLGEIFLGCANCAKLRRSGKWLNLFSVHFPL
jgi:hypothetical protein